MTREEKISRLKDILSEINENDNAVCYLTSEDNELIESAIEALEQEPQTFEWCKTCKEYNQDKHCCPRYNKVIRSAVEEIKQCEEAISREEAIGAVANLFEMSEYPHPYPQGKPIRLRDIKEKLKQLPSVQPKIKVGHWIDIMVGDMQAQACDQCKTFYPLAYTGGGHRFCPNCGAKMVELQAE